MGSKRASRFIRFAYDGLRCGCSVVLALALLGCGTSDGGAMPADPSSEPPFIESAYAKAVGEGGASLVAGGYESAEGTAQNTQRGGFYLARMAPSGARAWTRRFEGAGQSAINGLLVGGDGRTLVTGWYTKALSWTAGRKTRRLEAAAQAEMFLVALDSDGTVLWSTSSATEGDDRVYTSADLLASPGDGACMVAGNVVGTATFGSGSNEEAIQAGAAGSCFVACYTAAGQLSWVRGIEGSLDVERGAALATNSRGEVMVVGDAWNRDGAPSRRGLFLASYAGDGSRRWLRHTHGDSSIGGQSAAISPEGARVVTGWFMGRIEFETSSGRLPIEAQGTMDLFVVCFGPSGELRWVHTAGGEGESYAEGVGAEWLADGSLDVSATFGGSIRVAKQTKLEARCVDDRMVARFDAQGNLLHARLVEPESSEVR